jgi:geranylgeranyl diphosphate synthase type II
MSSAEAIVSSALETFLAEQRVRTNAILQQIARELAATEVGNAMRYALQGGGKRLRPALCVACYRALGGGDDHAIHRLAAALEIIHTYSLVHDDLPCMDNDDVRRGRRTTHRVFGNETAMLAGAALIPLAFRVANEALADLEVSADVQQRVHALLARSAGAPGMVGGQLLDLMGGADITSAPQLALIHSAKTGALIGAACVTGALAAGALPHHLDAMADYARHLGLAFQITDDVLDETVSTAELGKTAGKDRDVAKATYPALLGLPAARERARGEAKAAREALGSAGLSDILLNELAVFAIERRR